MGGAQRSCDRQSAHAGALCVGGLATNERNESRPNTPVIPKRCASKAASYFRQRTLLGGDDYIVARKRSEPRTQQSQFSTNDIVRVSLALHARSKHRLLRTRARGRVRESTDVAQRLARGLCEQCREQHTPTLLQDGVRKVTEGLTDLKQVLAVCSR